MPPQPHNSERILELPADHRPREKLLAHGAGALSDQELIALFLNTGSAGKNAITLAAELLAQSNGLQGLLRSDATELTSIKGIGNAKASHLLAAFELARRLAQHRAHQIPLNQPEAIYDYLGPELQRLHTESLRVILLNTRHQLLRQIEITRGSVNESIAPINSILRPTIIHQAYAFILVHNHPSGDPSPSRADHLVTEKLQQAASYHDSKFLDHIIIGSPSTSRPQPYYSFRESGHMD